MKNNYTVCEVDNSRYNVELVKFRSLRKDEPFIIDQELTTLIIKLTDLLCFGSSVEK